MFSMTDAVIGLSILAIVFAGVLTWRADVASESEADRAAALFVTVQRSAERYLEDRYPHIERCLNGAQWAARWRQRRLDVVNGVTGALDPPNASNFVPVPLYPDAASAPGATDPGYLGARAGPPLLRAVLGVPAAGPCLPSLAAAGVLPASLGALRYDSADPSAHLYADRYDLRLIARLVQLDPDPGALEPVIGVQMLLTMKTPEGEPLPYRSASAIAERTRLASVGLLSSLDVGSASAESSVLGFGGGWALDVCVPTAPALLAEAAAVRTLTAYDPALSAYASTAVPGAATLTGTPLGFALPSCRDAAHMGDVRTVALYRGTSDVALFALARPSFERLSGDALDGAAPASARVVAIVHRSRSAAMRTVLHREPIPGFAELQRMETDIDAGGYGTVNSGFVAGVDTDGDGIVNQGTQVVGPPPAALWTSGDAPPPGYLPTTFHGDVHIRGALVVHDGEYPLRTDLAGEPGKAANFQPGTLVVSGPTFLDPDPQRLLDGPSPVVRAQVNGGFAWDSTVSGGAEQRLYGPGSLRVRASSDATLADADQHGAVSIHAGRVSLGAFSGVPVRNAATQAALHKAPTVHADIADGPAWAYGPPQALEADDVLPGGTAAATMAARDTSAHRASLELFTAAENAPAMLATEHSLSGVFLASAGERSPVRAQTIASGSDVSLSTAAEKSPVHVGTLQEASPVQVETAQSDAGVWVSTVLADSPIVLGTAGDDSRVVLATVGDDAHVDLVTSKSRIAVAALDSAHVVPHDPATLRSTFRPPGTPPSTPPDVAALDLGVWSDAPSGVDSRAAFHTEDDDSPIDIFTRKTSSKVAVAVAHDAGRRTHLDPTEALDLGVWSVDSTAPSGVAIHTEAALSPVDIFTKHADAKVVLAAARSAGKASSEASTAGLDLGTWTASVRAALHTKEAGSPIDVFTRGADSKVAVAAAYTAPSPDRPTAATHAAALDLGAWAPSSGGVALHSDPSGAAVDIYTRDRAPIVVAAIHGTGALRSASIPDVFVDIGSYGSSAPVAVHTEQSLSPVDVYTKSSSSNVVLAASHASGRRSAASSNLGAIDIASYMPDRRVSMYSQSGNSPVDVFTMADSSKLAIGHGSSSLPSSVATADLDVATYAANTELEVHTRAEDSHLRAFTGAARSSVSLYSAATDSPVSVYTESARSPIAVHSEEGESSVSLYTEASGSDAYLYTHHGEITLNAEYDVLSTTSANGQIHIDPDEFVFAQADDHIDTLQLAAALGGLSHPYGGTFDVNGAASTGCPGGTTDERTVVIPTGWSRSGFPYERDITITVTVPGHGSSSGTFTVHEPYTGWSADPTTGADDGTGHLIGGPGTVDFTTVVLCKTTS